MGKGSGGCDRPAFGLTGSTGVDDAREIALEQRLCRLREDVEYRMPVTGDAAYSCDTSGCYEEGICRCGVIVGLEVDRRINAYDVLGVMIGDLAPYHPDESDGEQHLRADLYVEGRLIGRERPSVHDLDWQGLGDYYGESLDSVHFGEEFRSRIETRCRKYQQETALASLGDKLRYALMVEYGKVLPHLERAQFRIEPIQIDAVHLPAVKHANELDREHADAYRQSLSDGPAELARIPQFVTVRRAGELRLVDGYHRHAALMALAKTRPKHASPLAWVADLDATS